MSGRTDLPALGPHVLSESQIYSLPTRPNSINNELYGNELVFVLSFVSVTLFRMRSRGKKIKNPAHIKDHFLPALEIHLGTYINLYSFKGFSENFFLRSKQKYLITKER